MGIDRRASQSFGPYTQYVKVGISQHFFVYFCLCVVSLSVSVAYQCDIPGGLRLLREVASTRKLVASQHNYYDTECSLVTGHATTREIKLEEENEPIVLCY